MININKELLTINDDKSIAKLILQIHDELIYEVQADKIELVSNIIKNCMENVIRLDKIPLKVKIKIGNDWENMKPYI